MSNEFQNQFDIDLAFKLCQDVIEQREFESLLELDYQCKLLAEQSKTAIVQQQLNLSPEEDGLCILLYYIYYIMLDAKEREIFINLKDFIVMNNYNLYMIYKEFDYDNNKDISLEEKKLFKFAKKIINKYINNSQEEIDYEKLNKLIQYIYVEDFEQISSHLYLIFMMGFSLFNKDQLAMFIQDAAQLRFYNITIIIINRFTHDRESFEDREENQYEYIEQEADELRF